MNQFPPAVRTTLLRGSLIKVLVPLCLAGILYGINNLAILSGWLYPPAGYEPILMVRAQDIALYMSWLSAFQTQTLIPNYATPWATEPAFFNVFMWLLARVADIARLDLSRAVLAAHLVLYVIAAFALFLALDVFTTSRTQAFAALLVILGTLPIAAYLILPAYLINPGDSLPLFGIGDFVWTSSDGFFHGISASPLVTFGTAFTLLAFSLLAIYFQTNQKRYLILASLVTFLLGLVHATEVFVIVSAGALALFLRLGRNWYRARSDVFVFSLSGALGLAPYILLTLQHPWIRDLAEHSRWHQPGPPLAMLAALGVPTIVVLLSFVVYPRVASSTDILLRCWFCVPLIGIYVPIVPAPQHLFDGFHYVAGILLVRQMSQSLILERIWGQYRGLAVSALGLWALVTLVPYNAYFMQSFQDGNAVSPKRLFSTIAPRDEIKAIAWLRQNGRSDQLVLAPADIAPWLATVPMYSFAGHWHWSLTYEQQRLITDKFFAGRMTPSEAKDFLSAYGVSYVVVPDSSPAREYLNDVPARAKFDRLAIYRVDGSTIKPYGTRPDLAASTESP